METHYQAVCQCGYKSRTYTDASKAWSIRDNHMWNVHNEYPRSNSAEVIVSTEKENENDNTSM